MFGLYDIQPKYIHMSPIPYVPEKCPWIMKNHKPHNTATALILSDKDASRLVGGKYYERISLTDWEKYWPWLDGYDTKCYVITVPGLDGEVGSG